jgi:hypothetical protein
VSRRCKKGQRARIIGGRNAGKIVLIVRPYFYPQIINDASWPMAIYPWVVTSLSGSLRSVHVNSGKECPPAMTIVADDPELEPLDDEDDLLPEAEDLDVPIANSNPLHGLAA